jgi:hypothetical protein
MKVSKGLATWAGLVAAVGQYLAAVAVFLEADTQTDALGPLVTATATLLAVIVGRMQQAKALASRPTSLQTLGRQAASMGLTTSSGAAGSTHYWTSGGAVSLPDDEPGDPDALPDYQTETDPPLDEGDISVNGDIGEREG